ncbi:MAG: diguanylate cyclase [Candidatus Gastranaerophilaceae bacterium]|jgi:diguanylate cyclase (GGDEF)-like protein
MLNKFLKKIKNFTSKVNEIETNVSGERKNFMEIFERNLMLEEEIAERTDELSQANKSILTIKHIWSTMNSAEPLSEVLKTIVKGMTEDLGYLQCFIFQVFSNEEEKYLKIREIAKNKFTEKIRESLHASPECFCISMKNTDNIIVSALNDAEIKNSNTFSSIFKGIKPALNSDQLEEIDKMFTNRSISVLPIISQEKPFGCLVVVSIRNEIMDTEKNFLSLFAGQIELAVTIADLFETIREQAITDGLTGLYNRRHFDQCLISEAKRAIRLNQPFTLITLDLDRLKVINDTFGHSAGDSAICIIGDVLKRNARSIDIPARFGGEEFGLVLPGIDVEGGIVAAERLRVAIESARLDGVGQVTASIGVGTFLKHSSNLEEYLELVDQAMYRAKRNGRNQVQLAQAWDENIWKRQAIDSLMNLLSKNTIPIDRNLAESLNEKLRNINVLDKNVDELIFCIVDDFTSAYKNSYNRGSIKQKIELIVKIAQEYNLHQEEIDKIKMAAMVYDLSNMLLPEDILLKPGPLSDGERSQVQKHPIVASKEILEPIGTASNIISFIEHWNENYDGSGHPGRLKGEEIPIGTRILVVVDAYFALICERPYRKSYSIEETIKILEEGVNKKWDGKIVMLLKEIVYSAKETI